MIDNEIQKQTPGEKTSLAEIGGLFLKHGTIAFSNPATHISMVENEILDQLGAGI